MPITEVPTNYKDHTIAVIPEFKGPPGPPNDPTKNISKFWTKPPTEDAKDAHDANTTQEDFNEVASDKIPASSTDTRVTSGQQMDQTTIKENAPNISDHWTSTSTQFSSSLWIRI